MNANTASTDISERDETRHIDMTTVRTSRVADFAETELGDDVIEFERRGGWTYLVVKGT